MDTTDPLTLLYLGNYFGNRCYAGIANEMDFYLFFLPPGILNNSTNPLMLASRKLVFNVFEWQKPEFLVIAFSNNLLADV